MNRPFSAFAALLGLLALSMFAVSSTTRSTTVQAPRPSVGHLRLDAARPFFAAHDQPDYGGARATQPFDHGATSKSCEQLAAASIAGASGLCGVEIQIAEPVVSATMESPVSGELTQYDPVYDLAVYGAKAAATFETPRAGFDSSLQTLKPTSTCAASRLVEGVCRGYEFPGAEAPGCIPAPLRGLGDRCSHSTSFTKSDGDLLAVYDSFGVERSAGAERTSRKLTIMIRSLWSRLVGCLAACESWAVYKADEWKSRYSWQAKSNEMCVAWDDYAALIDQATAAGTEIAKTRSKPVDWNSVRFGDWLRHSAASSWRRYGRLLEAAGVELQQSLLPMNASAGGAD